MVEGESLSQSWELRLIVSKVLRVTLGLIIKKLIVKAIPQSSDWGLFFFINYSFNNFSISVVKLSGVVFVQYLSTTVPFLSIRNFVKFHLMLELRNPCLAVFKYL